ncbi:hypothetical protein, partial [Escherichia coli]|uniref:hypothetical protein n=1 Tax=Escherichia coli TaxID=562 RepID=UPI00207C6EA8
VYGARSGGGESRCRPGERQRVDGEARALVGSEDVPVLDENTFNSHAPAPSSR